MECGTTRAVAILPLGRLGSMGNCWAGSEDTDPILNRVFEGAPGSFEDVAALRVALQTTCTFGPCNVKTNGILAALHAMAQGRELHGDYSSAFSIYLMLLVFYANEGSSVPRALVTHTENEVGWAAERATSVNCSAWPRLLAEVDRAGGDHVLVVALRRKLECMCKGRAMMAASPTGSAQRIKVDTFYRECYRAFCRNRLVHGESYC